MRMTCDANGEWNAPECRRITCPPPNPIYRGLYECSDANNHDSVCSINCPNGVRIGFIHEQS